MGGVTDRRYFGSLVATIAELSSENQNFTIENLNVCARAPPMQQAITGRQYGGIFPPGVWENNVSTF